MPKDTNDEVLQQRVDAALDTAVQENGYEEIVTWAAICVARDLIACSPGFEDYTPDKLRSYVWDWQQRHGGERVELKWATGPYSGETMYVPKKVLERAEASLIQKLTEQCSSETQRANKNALETFTLGRHLSVAVKALEGVREVILAVRKLRRVDSIDANTPEATPTVGFIALQDGQEVDNALEVAAKYLQQLEKEYPC